MAKFLPGPTVAEVRGSIGGTVYSRNRYGAYMRWRAKPTVSVTPEALTAKARMTAATQSWQTQSTANRLAWNQWANANPIVGSMGESQILTGHVAFVGVNVRRLIQAMPILSTPPLSPAPAPLTNLTVAPNATLSTCDVTFTATPLAADERLWILATQQPSAGKVWVENLLKGGIVSAIAEVSPFDAFAVITARIGALVIGDFLHLKVFVMDRSTGLLSAPLRSTDVVI